MIRLSKKYELELLSLPFSRGDNQVIFIESKYNPEINNFIQDHIEDLKKLFAEHGLEFCYVPEVCERFWETSESDWDGIPYDRGMLQEYGSHLRTDQVFGSDAVNGEIPPSLICNTVGERKDNNIVFEAYHLDISHIDKEYLMIEEFRQIARAYSRINHMEYSTISSDKETIMMLNEMERLARALKLKGVKVNVFDQMIRSLETPVAITVNHRGNIVLPELGGITIKLNPMEKTIYNFFLCHPVGLQLEDIGMYRREIEYLYRKSTVYDEPSTISEKVKVLLTDRQSLHVVLSHIRTKFRDTLGDSMANNYIIAKGVDDYYRISLPSHMVSRVDSTWIP